MTPFETALTSFVETANQMLDDGINKTAPSVHFLKKLRVDEGRKFVRIVMTEGPEGVHGSAFCFINKETGDVLKAASWKTPAKNFARGNIFDAKNGLGRFCWTGMR